MIDEPEPISPNLFDYVDRAIEGLSSETIRSRVAPTAPIREFCENFFAQFFERVLRVDAQPISAAGALEARRLSRRRGKHAPSAESRVLLQKFQKLCKLEPDLRGGDYGGGVRVYRAFHSEFVPDLLQDIAEWAESEELDAIRSRAADTTPAYRQAAEKALK